MLPSEKRLQCRSCGAHTGKGHCGNCLSRDLGPVDRPKRFAAARGAALPLHGRESGLAPHWTRSQPTEHL